MSIEEAIRRYEKLIAAFDMEMSNVSKTMAINAKALVINRIQTKGIGKTYSTKKIPAYLLLLDESRLDTQQTINYVKSVEASENEEDRYLNWADVRQAHGNQTAFVDLTFTGRMLNNIGVIKTEKVGNAYVTTIGGFEKEVRDKMIWNAKRYGDFLILVPEEKKMISELGKSLISEVTKKYLEE